MIILEIKYCSGKNTEIEKIDRMGEMLREINR